MFPKSSPMQVLATENVADVIVLHGLVPEIDQQKSTFHLQLLDGNRVEAPLTRRHFAAVMQAFNEYQKGAKIRLLASGKSNGSDRFFRIDHVTQAIVLDPMDLGVRLEEFRNLEDGWLDGGGRAPPSKGLDWLAVQLGLHFSAEFPVPYLYPTAEGNVRAEWSIKSQELSLDIDLESRIGSWHVLDLESDSEQTRILNLAERDEWEWIKEEVQGRAEEVR